MRFSIVIPTYNSKKSLNNTLESLNYQAGYGKNDYEVVVADDGSSDDTFEYIRNTPKNYEMRYVYLERTPQSCRSRTRNAGRKAAQGDIIAYMDADMIVRNNFLLEVDRYFKHDDRFLLLGTRLMIDEPIDFNEIKTGKVFERYPFDPKNFDTLEYRHYLFEKYSYNATKILFPWLQVYSCNIIAAKKWLDQTGGFDETLKKWGMEDVEFGYSLYKLGLRVAVNAKLEAIHQNHGARNDLIIETSKKAGYDENIDYFLKKHPEALGFRPSVGRKCLRGDIPLHKFDLFFPKETVHLSCKNGQSVDALKMEISDYMNGDGYDIIVEDFREDVDLDIWIQSLENTRSTVRYYPHSKRISMSDFEAFLAEEKQRQLERDAIRQGLPMAS